MTDPTPGAMPVVVEKPLAITFKTFLESVHPSIEKEISQLWYEYRHSSGGVTDKLLAPELRLHCAKCAGERTFRLVDDEPQFTSGVDQKELFLTYQCGDCHESYKSFSLMVTRRGNSANNMTGKAYKFGEQPPYGVPVPSRLLRLFGKDSATFLKGRQCENQGLGVGAFAYYRRVVENHRNDIFDAILKVCETVGAEQSLVEELKDAKGEISFTKSLDKIKSGLPQGLLIDGHNPLIALHNALSVGLHTESDEGCLEAAQDVRLVLTDLVEKMASLREENADLKTAVQRLIAKRTASSAGDF